VAGTTRPLIPIKHVVSDGSGLNLPAHRRMFPKGWVGGSPQPDDRPFHHHHPAGIGKGQPRNASFFRLMLKRRLEAIDDVQQGRTGRANAWGFTGGAGRH